MGYYNAVGLYINLWSMVNWDTRARPKLAALGEPVKPVFVVVPLPRQGKVRPRHNAKSKQTRLQITIRLIMKPLIETQYKWTLPAFQSHVLAQQPSSVAALQDRT